MFAADFIHSMKHKILEKAGEMFINYGFKSITMDDIAKQMGISKKTIYAHFKNKTKLIEQATLVIFELISSGIDCICEMQKNPIEELYAIKSFVMENLKNEKSSPQFQLQKYYPEIFHKLKLMQLEVMQKCIIKNLERGIEEKLYRNEIDLNFISRIYFNGIVGIKDEETFPLDIFSPNYLLESYLEYHIRAVATNKGLLKLEKLLSKNEK